jgi:hypothetical protein
MAVSLSRPLRGIANALPVGNPPVTEAQFAELGKFCYLWFDQSFSYKEATRWRAGSLGN